MSFRTVPTSPPRELEMSCWATGDVPNGFWRGRLAAVRRMLALSLATGYIASCCLASVAPAFAMSNVAVTWGEDSVGQLGRVTGTLLPGPVLGPSGVAAVSAGEIGALAALTDGSVVTWGARTPYTTPPEIFTTPVPVAGITDASEVVAGGQFSGIGAYRLALLRNGEVATITHETSSCCVLSGVKQIAGSGNHFLALMNDGTVRSWGRNTLGQVGDGTQTDKEAPTPLPGLTGVVQVAAGREYSAAVLEDGSVWTWGSDREGVLGHSTIECYSLRCSLAPARDLDLAGVASVSLGEQHLIALTQDGQVFERGNGTIIAGPVSTGESTVRAVSAGWDNGFVLRSDGTILSWGNNRALSLGVEGEFTHYTPEPIARIRGAQELSTSELYSVAVAPMPSVSALEPNHGVMQGGNQVTIRGTNLDATTVVQFGQHEARDIIARSEHELVVTAPDGVNNVQVTVVTEHGTSGLASAPEYHYTPSLVVKRLTPSKGSAAGGASVTLTGSGFTHATGVSFGGVAAASFAVQTDSTIVATSTPGTPGAAVPVLVQTPYGESAAGRARYTYFPTVTGVTPDAGPVAGGTVVTVTGSGFIAGSGLTMMKFGSASGTNVNCSSSTECTVKAPKHAAGTLDVTATVNKVMSPKTAADRYEYS